MKPNFTQATVGIAIAILVAACSAATPDKNAELEKLRSEYTKLGDQIKKLESELPKDSTAATVNAKDVDVVVLKTSKFDHYISTQGAIESIDNIQVSAKTAGIITQVYVVEGQTVTSGQVIGQIDNSLINRNIDEVKSSLELANTVFDRQKKLWDQKIGTEVQYLQAKSTRDGLERRLAGLNEQNDMTRIKAPLSGVVDEVTLRVGQNIAPGMPAARIVNNQNLKLKANVSEAFVSQIKKGNKAVIHLPDLDKEISAPVTFVGQNINTLSRSFVVEVKLPPYEYLRPNMSAVLKVIFETVDNAMVVPVNVVQDINGEKVIYTAETKGSHTVAHRNKVTVVGVYDKHAEVSSGLKVGDKVITVGYQGLNDGEFVKL